MVSLHGPHLHGDNKIIGRIEWDNVKSDQQNIWQIVVAQKILVNIVIIIIIINFQSQLELCIVHHLPTFPNNCIPTPSYS